MDCKASRLLVCCTSPSASAFHGNYSVRSSLSPPSFAGVRLTESFGDWEGLSLTSREPAPSDGNFGTRTRANVNAMSLMARGGYVIGSAAASPTLYDLLSVSRGATLIEIKGAYRQMARRYHPNVCPSDDKEKCSQMFVRVREAYETLSDPVLRRNYDCRLNGEKQIGIDGDWSVEWKAQLEELKRRSDANRSSSSTWGRRMRLRRTRGVHP